MRKEIVKMVWSQILLQAFRCSILILGIAISSASLAPAATVSGFIVIPDSDMGYKPNLYGMTSQVRIEGTALAANVVPSSRYEGTFSLPEVPNGAITLLFVEGTTDVFTQASKRVQIEVNGDVPGLAFDLVYHWKGLAGYPPNWQTTGYVNEWTPHFVSDQVGFMLFRVRGAGIDPERVELYRTIDGGESWEEIGHWVSGESPYPDFLDRNLYFADQDHGVIQTLVDVNAHPDVTWYHTQGVLYTADGGATWNYSDFPNPPEAGVSDNIQIHRFAGIDESHWIACGKNAGTSTYGDPQYNVIWETANGGASWEIKLYWQEAGGCTGLGADANGRAIAFFTPFSAGGGKKVVLRDSSGIWTRIDDNELITNSGYGPADIPMVGDTAWVRNTEFSTLPVGLYRSSNAGLEWEKISDALPQYMDFATENKGFGPAGGPMYVTYDGGVTWLYQSAGGGSCCHGNNVWAFDTTHAVWHEAGVGNPNDVPELFTYVEPWEANFEIVPGIPIQSGIFRSGARNVPLASYKILNHGPVPIRMNSLTLSASGTGNDQNDVSQVKIWHDRNSNGYVDEGDALLAEGVYPADDASLTLSFPGNILIEQLFPYYLLVTYDVEPSVIPHSTFVCTITASGVNAERADTNEPILPTAPPNYPLPGREATSAERIISFDGDDKTDIAVWRPADGTWRIVSSLDGSITIRAWGALSLEDIPVPGDYDGDGRTDLAVWRPADGVWWIINSRDESMTARAWGAGSLDDIPVPGDYDGDGKTDLAVWRPADGVWWIINSRDESVTARAWGAGSLNDIPVPGDYDGDGKTDLAVWRPADGVWWIINSRDESVTVRAWGAGSLNDIPVPGDYDGDGKTDLAVWRPGDGVWWIINSRDESMTARAWGAGSLNDIPVPGDYDGDGKTDLAVWRPADGTWWIFNSGDGSVITSSWGAGIFADLPVMTLPGNR